MSTPVSYLMTFKSRVCSYKRLLTIALIIFALDQASKLWIITLLPLGSYWQPNSIEIIHGFLYIVHIGNEGAAWGMFSGHGNWLAIFTIGALTAIYYLRESLELKQPKIQMAFGLLIGGVLGNLTDRILHGHVIDFIDVHLPFSLPYLIVGGRYPAFNVADCSIVIGGFYYALISAFSKPSGFKKSS